MPFPLSTTHILSIPWFFRLTSMRVAPASRLCGRLVRNGGPGGHSHKHAGTAGPVLNELFDRARHAGHHLPRTDAADRGGVQRADLRHLLIDVGTRTIFHLRSAAVLSYNRFRNSRY